MGESQSAASRDLFVRRDGDFGDAACRPSAFGMYTLREACARYAPRCTRPWSSASRASRPCSYCCQLTPSTPGMDLSPSRTGLLAQTLWRSPGSRAHCLLTCLDSSTTPSPAATRDLTRLADVAFPLTEKGRHPVACFRSSMILPASPLSTLRYDPSRDHRQDSRPEWSRFSFSVGLSHPLQCAGLSRRSLSTKSPYPSSQAD